MTERKVFESLAHCILEPTRESLSDSEYDIVTDDIVSSFEHVDRKDMSSATQADFKIIAELTLRHLSPNSFSDQLVTRLAGAIEGFTASDRRSN